LFFKNWLLVVGVLFIIPLPFAYYLVQILLIEFQIQKTVVASFSPSVFVFKNEQR